MLSLLTFAAMISPTTMFSKNSNVFADETNEITDNRSTAEKQLYTVTNISESDINNRLSDFTKTYLENKNAAQSVIDGINNNFIQSMIYYETSLKDKSYEEMKKEFTVIPDNTMLVDYKKTYKTYENEKGTTIEENTVFDEPEFNTVLSNSYWKEAYAAFKTYTGYTENNPLSSSDYFQKYIEAFLNVLKNKNGFFSTCLKAHVDKYYYNEATQSVVEKKDFENYIKEKNKVSKAKKETGTYDAELEKYENMYLSKSAYYAYLQQTNDSTISYKTYVYRTKNGKIAGIPRIPEKPKDYKKNKEIIEKSVQIETVKLHEKIIYTLSETEPSQVMSDYESRHDKILRWAYETLNTLTSQSKTIDATAKSYYSETLSNDYDAQFSAEREQIVNELNSALSAQLQTKDIGSRIVTYAKSRIGCRYYWGATGDDMFDCSGLVYWSLNKAGISVPRLTANLYGNSGTEITSTDEILPGDVISIGKTTNYTHIGIYAGNGEVVEATGEGATCKGEHANHVVKITPLNKFITRYANYTIRRLY